MSPICVHCHCGTLQAHHQWPEKYVKCSICGFTREKDSEKDNSITGVNDGWTSNSRVSDRHDKRYPPITTPPPSRVTHILLTCTNHGIRRLQNI